MRAYGMPEIVTESVMETDAYFSRPDNEFGYVAYDGDVAVSTATVIAIDGWLYVALVATDPAHRQKGYAEAVMRHALSVASIELGITRTALDASAMGAPVYERMGYRFTGERWSMFVPAH
ncbi:MAG: GNAT family N-acetyltransferase [Acidobacteria bacterium]|nr:GNAT family N-acetyltransferase [Acidobacteriota bacterium]